MNDKLLDHLWLIAALLFLTLIFVLLGDNNVDYPM